MTSMLVRHRNGLLRTWRESAARSSAQSGIPVLGSSSSPGFAASRAAARPLSTPRWSPASRAWAAAADRSGRLGGTGSVLGIAPGIRLAFGCRLGSPAAVEPAEDGESAVSAARQPSSAGDDQRLSVVAVRVEVLGAPRRPLNQLDSTASKTGSLHDSVVTPSAGGVAMPSEELVSWLKPTAVPAAGPAACDVSFQPGTDQPGVGTDHSASNVSSSLIAEGLGLLI